VSEQVSGFDPAVDTRQWHRRSDAEYRGLVAKFVCLVLAGPVAAVGWFFLGLGAAASRGSDPKSVGTVAITIGLVSVLMFLYGLGFPWGLIRLFRAHQKERDVILLHSLYEQVAARQAGVATANLLAEMAENER